MVKFDFDMFKFLTKEYFRVLTAIEMGMRNHQLVPTQMIESISGVKRGGAFKIISKLHKWKLIRHDSQPYDGYTLKYLGYDYLAIKAMVQRGHIADVGRRIGTGKESDVFEAYQADGRKVILKLHRLGRISFQKVKQKRDYLGNRHKSNWLYMSRLSALREFAYMKALYNAGFKCPIPEDVSRHAVLMSHVPGKLLLKVLRLDKPESVYNRCMDAIVKLAEHGLIHCDYNEFNLILAQDRTIWLIDFPQMVSTDHFNAAELFDRDVKNVVDWFIRKYGFRSDYIPKLADVDIENADSRRLDWEVDASGVDAELRKSILEEVTSIAGGDSGDLQEHIAPSIPEDSERGELDSKPDDNEQPDHLDNCTTQQSKVEYNKEKLAALKTTAEVIINKKKTRRKNKSSRELSEKDILARLKKKTKVEARRRRMLKGRKAGAKQKLRERTKKDMRDSIW